MLTPFRIVATLFAVALAATAPAQDAPKSKDLTGWWAADPVHAGERSHLALQIIERDGEQEAHLSLPDIGAYDINLGEVTLTGNLMETKGLKFPLTWDAATRTLKGVVPADAAPIYDIPVVFARGAPLIKPPPNEWKGAPRPTARWTVDTGAPVWAGIERGGDGTLYVANEDGWLHAIRAGKVL